MHLNDADLAISIRGRRTPCPRTGRRRSESLSMFPIERAPKKNRKCKGMKSNYLFESFQANLADYTSVSNQSSLEVANVVGFFQLRHANHD